MTVVVFASEAPVTRGVLLYEAAWNEEATPEQHREAVLSFAAERGCRAEAERALAQPGAMERLAADGFVVWFTVDHGPVAA